MKNKIRSLVLALLVPFIHLSQYDTIKSKVDQSKLTHKYNGYFTFGIGSAIPKGLLAEQNVKNDSAGLAFNGLDLRFSFGYLLHHNFGLCAAYYFQSFKVNSKALDDHYTNINPGYSFNVGFTKPWRLNGTLFGIYGKLLLDDGKKISLEPRLMIGVSTGHSPEYSVTSHLTGNGFTQSATANQSSDASDPVVTYVIGGTLRMELDRFCMSANVDYTNLLKNTHYHSITITYSANGNGTTQPPDNISASQEMRSIAITVGIGFRFGKRKFFQ